MSPTDNHYYVRRGKVHAEPAVNPVPFSTHAFTVTEYGVQSLERRDFDTMHRRWLWMIDRLRRHLDRADAVPLENFAASIYDHHVHVPAEGPQDEEGNEVLAEVVDPTHVLMRLAMRGRPRHPDVDETHAA